MLTVFVDVPLGKSKIDEEDLMRGLVESNTEVIWFDVSVNEVSVVDVLDPCNHLVDEHEDSFQGQFSKRLVEE